MMSLLTLLQSILNASMLWTNYEKYSAYDDIYQVEPGSYLIYQNGKLSIKKYWENAIYDFNANDKSCNKIKKFFS